MKRTDFIKKLGTAGVATIGAGQLLASTPTPANSKPVYFHYLLFWLKPGLSAKEVNDFTQFFEGLKKLPYVKNVRYGRPAASTPRAVLDNSFTYNCSMEFDTLEELEAYGKLPAHLELVAKYKPFFEKMMVHDSLYNA